MSPRLRVRWLGRVEYDEAWDLQRAIWEGRTGGRTTDDYLLLLEHPHTYTVGRNGDGSNLRVSKHALADLERALHEHIHLENNILHPRALQRQGH